LICALTLSATTEAQQWQQKQRFPSQGRDHPVGFGINDTGYAMVGMVETVAGITFLDDFYRYLPSEDKWETLQNFPGAARGFSIGVAHQGKGYIGFGTNGASYLIARASPGATRPWRL
jgi:N-acetylneuraminic acid mutarotase